MPLVSAIIPIYGQFDYARLTIESFLESQFDSVAIVVDDFSPDWTTDWMKGLDKSRIIVHRFDNNTGVTRSWNWGIQKAHDIGSRFVAVANSDLVFPNNWFEPFIQEFKFGWEFLGPLTNAPGNIKQQNIRQYIDRYRADDEPFTLTRVVDGLQEIKPSVLRNKINGFCMIGRPESWIAYGMFNEKKHPMTHQETSFFRHVSSHGGGNNVGILLHSFVLHYRSITKGLHRGKLDTGNFRKE